MDSRILNPKTFCIGPYTEVRINTNGSMNFCHYANNDMIPIEENINQMTVDEYFSSSNSAITARQRLEQGLDHSRCSRCYHTEQMGLISNRTRRNIQYAIFPDQDFEQSSQECDLWNGFRYPRFYHVSLSNLCNLSCVMCDQGSSSLWTSTMQKAGLIPRDVPILLDWTQGPAWKKFCDHLLSNPDIVCLHFMGGEPFYHKKFRELLDMLIESDHTDFALTVVTNGTIYDPTLMESLSKFKSVQVEVSLESVDIANDYIRYPSDHTVTMSNIDKILSHRTEKFDVILRTVPQLLSLYHYDRMMEWSLERNMVVDSNLLTWPNYFRPEFLPDEIKYQVQKKMERFIIPTQNKQRDINVRDSSKVPENHSNNAREVIKRLAVDPLDRDQHWQEMCRRMSMLDRVRGIDARLYFPHLSDELEKYGYSI